MNGWIVLDKPLGLSSGAAVGAVKRLARESGWPRVRIGHGGTLDPLATGVLPVALGEATKLAGRLLDATKAYRFTLRFGEARSTDDLEGEVVATCPLLPTPADVRAVLHRFTGPIEQVPPAYSALKVDGRRAYALARAGQAVALQPRSVTVHRLELAGAQGGDAIIDVTCSKGTYVRALARDIAAALGTVGHVAALRRTRAGPFGERQAFPLDKLSALVQTRRLEQALLPLTAGLDDIPAFAVDSAEAARLRQGQQLGGCSDKSGLHVATHASVAVALVDVSPAAVRIVRGFNL